MSGDRLAQIEADIANKRRPNPAEVSMPTETAESLVEIAKLLIRIRQWDALNPLPEPIPAPFGDMPYWVAEIDRVLARLDRPSSDGTADSGAAE